MTETCRNVVEVAPAFLKEINEPVARIDWSPDWSDAVTGRAAKGVDSESLGAN